MYQKPQNVTSAKVFGTFCISIFLHNLIFLHRISEESKLNNKFRQSDAEFPPFVE